MRGGPAECDTTEDPSTTDASLSTSSVLRPDTIRPRPFSLSFRKRNFRCPEVAFVPSKWQALVGIPLTELLSFSTDAQRLPEMNLPGYCKYNFVEIRGQG
ncbi:MAG: hypothetical protein FRX49_10563 [Trebouxia sp. A1-2]|nr:MAG: hypothetical protein FRX49_10563 [Trebouxia sp. A1-2]